MMEVGTLAGLTNCGKICCVLLLLLVAYGGQLASHTSAEQLSFFCVNGQ